MMTTYLRGLFWALVGISALNFSSAQNEVSPYYTPSDDASWAIRSKQLSSLLGESKQALYDDFISGCNAAVAANQKHRGKRECSTDDWQRLKMNRLQPSSVYNYTKKGYEKIRAPKELFDAVHDFWVRNKDKANIEWKHINTYHNMWDAPPTIVLLNNASVPGGGPEFQAKIWKMASPILEEWTGQELNPVSLYGIRLYHNNSILTPHVDRMPLVISAIINVDQDVDEPWPLEVYGHDGKATNITMEPGDMVLYESHSVIHGRPFPFKGNFYANVFVHFEPLGPLDPNDEGTYDPNLDIPPYVIPDSVWEKEWMKTNRQGWRGKVFDPRIAAGTGDVKTLIRIARADSTALHHPDANGWKPLHEAARSGQVEALQIILLNGGDINHVTNTNLSPLDISHQYLGKQHKMTKFLLENGGVSAKPEL